MTNCCKIALYVQKNFSLQQRSFSALCDVRRHKIDLTRQTPILLQKPPITTTMTERRSFSLEGFVAWQEKTYASISNSGLVNVMQDGLLYFHDTTGLPWWATIVAATVLVRTGMTLPLTVYQYYILAKVENISLELKELVEELKRETAIAKKVYKLTDKQAMILYKRSLKKQWNDLIVRDNCHPFKSSLVMWLQIPIWVCMSFALRNLVYMQPISDAAALITFTELSVGGLGWIPNLTVPDHSLVIPIAFGLTNLALIEIQRMSKLRQPSRVYNIFTNVFRVFSIVMIPVAASVPSCMCLYWMTSSSYGLVQNLVLLSPSLRRKLRIPLAPSELEEPYKHLKDEFRHKLQRFPLLRK
ncbi:cytochrome c oxidase assembly protein COX18, mitochondrial [Plutella xylostella]|uniref:cytochrome c oxidase assembly protein COX18, mitochondrial n=1 Tax=Plutella xylostella TaxID=51655 RepID=UPI0020326AB4|nr:cytochrome c oxidase assembly protein COX18, mitochondrial [Plutella xylostella]